MKQNYHERLYRSNKPDKGVYRRLLLVNMRIEDARCDKRTKQQSSMDGFSRISLKMFSNL